ncbi:MAG: hypothetical protein JSV44_08280, partial [Candidatus Zixiibacteriota bacterium]
MARKNNSPNTRNDIASPPKVGKSESVPKIVTARTIKELERHADAWNNLALTTPQRLPVLSYSWIVSYLEHRLKPDSDWICLFAYDGDQLRGVLPVVAQPIRLMGIRRIHLSTPADWHTVSADFLSAPGWETTIIPMFLGKLNAVFPGWHCLELRRLPNIS